jgi:hypothetical protein
MDNGVPLRKIQKDLKSIGYKNTPRKCQEAPEFNTEIS